MLKLYNVKTQHMCGQLLGDDNTVCSLTAPGLSVRLMSGWGRSC